MIHSRHLAPLLLLGLLAGCGDAHSFDIEAKPQFWGDYSLTLALPGKSTPVYSVLQADGKVKRHGGFAEDPSMKTEGQRALDLRDRAY